MERDAENKDCVPCDEGCEKCKLNDSEDLKLETVCIKCEDGYYQLGHECHQSCPDKTYSVSDTMVCAPCEDKQCQVCDEYQCYWKWSAQKGLEVAESRLRHEALVDTVAMGRAGIGAITQPQYDNVHGKERCQMVLNEVGAGVEEERTTKMVAMRQQSAWTRWEDGGCVDHCGEDFFVDEESRECELCHRNCRTCRGPRFEDCDTCKEGFTLKNGECLESRRLAAISDMHFRNSQFKRQSCHTSCDTCSGKEQNECESCHPGWFLTPEHTCKSHCPSDTFANTTSGQCEACSKGCALCHKAQQCLQCHNGLYRENGACVDECHRGMPKGDICQPCAMGCGSCAGNPTYCLSCERPYLLLNNSCRSNCPERFYPNGTECHHCPDHCIECAQDGLCKNCATYYFLHEDKCVDDCPDGYFASEKQQECVRCHADCASCDGPDYDDCIECLNPAYVRYNGECVSKCPNNTYYNKTTSECRVCHSSCLTCSGPEPSSCLSCDSNSRIDANGHCVWYSPCSPTSYTDPYGECQKCHELCHSCYGPDKDHCLSCKEPRFLLRDTCVQDCPVGYYADVSDGRECRGCHFSCQSCTGHRSVECVVCKPGFYQEGRTCVETCSESHFGNRTTMEPTESTGGDTILPITNWGDYMNEASLVFPSVEHNSDLRAGNCGLTGTFSDLDDQSISLNSDEDEQDIGLFDIPLAAKPTEVSGTSSGSPTPASSDLHEVCKRAAAKLGISWPEALTKMATSRYEGKHLPGAKTSTRQFLPVFPECLEEATRSRSNPLSAKNPIQGGSTLDCLDMEEKGFSLLPPVEPLLASHLHPAQKSTMTSVSPALPPKADNFQFLVTEKNNKAVAMSVRALNASSLLLTYQAELQDDISSSADVCILKTNFVMTAKEAEGSSAKLFVTVCVLLIVSVGVGFFLFLSARSRSRAIIPNAGGYVKLDTREGALSKPITSSLGEYNDRLTEREDEEEDDDIVYMAQDGIVYKKFKYGLLDEDDIDLEYDDESFSYR
ncbi:uncharacterized protein KZ484_002947 [Pholidichthys leucotaenia]